MDSKKNFIDRLKVGKPIFSVGLVDDMGDELREQIENQVWCNVDRRISIKDVNNRINKGGIYLHDLLDYDALFFDASYEDTKEGTSAISILEKLIQSNSAFANISRVLIGEDIIKYGQAGDFETRRLIARVQKLPHIIYGGERGTKTECMIQHIKSVAEKKGIDVPTVLPSGVCRPELLDKIQPYISSVSINLNDQSRLSIDILKDLKEYEPTNESERQLIENAREISALLMHNQHLISQLYCAMNMNYYRDVMKTESSTINSDDKEHE